MGRNSGFGKLNLGAENPMEISIIFPGILCPVPVSEFSSVRNLLSPALFTGLSVWDQVTGQETQLQTEPYHPLESSMLRDSS